jgi:hypothetical protein
MYIPEESYKASYKLTYHCSRAVYRPSSSCQHIALLIFCCGPTPIPCSPADRGPLQVLVHLLDHRLPNPNAGVDEPVRHLESLEISGASFHFHMNWIASLFNYEVTVPGSG